MKIDVKKIGDNQVSVHMYGGSALPLLPGTLAPPAPDFDWDFTITIDTSGGTPKYTVKGKYDGFPAYEVWIDYNKLIHEYTPGPGPYTFAKHLRLLFWP